MDIFDIQVDRESEVHQYQQVVDAIYDLILQDKLSGGEFLPGERSLAKKLGVDRDVVHHAYKTLVQDELIMFANHRGHRLIVEARERLEWLKRFKKKRQEKSSSDTENTDPEITSND
jgi:DNA-binding transcriptional regulator YhcF (GntR family)